MGKVIGLGAVKSKKHYTDYKKPLYDKLYKEYQEKRYPFMGLSFDRFLESKYESAVKRKNHKLSNEIHAIWVNEI